MLWASLLLPTLALDAALRERPAPERPFALVHGPAQQRTLLAVDEAARAAGLRPGQRLAEAEAVCRNLLTAEYDAAHTRAALSLIAAWAYRWSADVLLDPPRTVTLEVGRSLGLFGPWPKLEARLRGGLAQLGFRHRIALAPNPRAARVLAGARDGATVASANELPAALAKIPVARAGLPPDAAALLAGMGLRTLGQVLRLPRPALQRRCGKALVEALAILLGERPDPLAPYRPPDRFDARIDFGCEVRHVHGLLFPLKRMLGDLAAFLAARDGGVQRFSLRFVHADAAPSDLAIGLLAPERDAAALFEVAKLRLEQTRLPAPVLEMELHADELPAFVPAGVDLFDTRAARALPWPQLVERLRARLGEDAVHGLRVDPDPRPERACVRGGEHITHAPSTRARPSFRDDPKSLPRRPRHPESQAGSRVPPAHSAGGPGMTNGREDCAHRAPAPPTPTPPAPRPRPTWLLPRPIPLRGPLPTILAGPERLETGWWDGGDVRRDYYVVELSTGQRAWAFCAPGERGPFMLHGWFA